MAITYARPIPMATFDLDLFCRFDARSPRKIAATPEGLHPFHRLTLQKLPFELSPALIPPLKNLSLETDVGRLDYLSEVLGIGDYNKVLQNSIGANLSSGQFRFLSLDDLIRAKEAGARGRDFALLKYLKAIKEKRTAT